MDQHRGDGGIHARPTSPQITLRLADLVADALHRGGAEGMHVPFRRDAGDVAHEIGKDGRAARRMHHFGMELHAIEAALLVGDHGEGRAFRRRHHRKARRDGGDLVAMAHPHRLAAAFGQAFQQGRGVLAHEFRRGRIRGCGRLRPARPIAPPSSSRHSRCPAPARPARTRACGARGVSVSVTLAGPPDRMIARGLFRQRRLRLVVGHDLAIDPGLAHAPRDELGHLAAEIDDQNAHLAGVIGLRRRAGCRPVPARASALRARRRRLGSMASASS